MPANLPPQYYELEREFKAERDTAEKLRMAQELLAMMPKHKGTDKLQAEMKAKISKLKKELSGVSKKGGPAKSSQMDHIEREGAGQIILIGAPNSGKSSLLDYFTNARPLIGDYPYTTREPQPGMMDYESIQIQLIDTPPISPDLFETYLLGLIRNADIVGLVVGLETPGFGERVRFVVDKLLERRIVLTNNPPDPDSVEIEAGMAYKKALIIAHKIFDDDGKRRNHNLPEMFPGFTIVETSILDDEMMERLRSEFFKALNIIRVYTKNPGSEPDFTDPIILKPDASVEDAAIALHKDFAYKLQYAKIWGEGKHDGQRVQKTFKLIDGDIIEFHI